MGHRGKAKQEERGEENGEKTAHGGRREGAGITEATICLGAGCLRVTVREAHRTNAHGSCPRNKL